MDRYLLAEQLGDGSFGRVMKATLKENGDVVAIKHIKRKFKTWRACVDLREVQSLRVISHPNIVLIKEVIRESDESLYFVFEYMPDGSLYELMKRCTNTQSLSEASGNEKQLQILSHERICSIIRQIMSGLSYMHSRGYFHRDIKPENILVNGDICKVADFGLAREVRSLPPYTYYVSTRWYRAPEVILRNTWYGPPIDMFATGLILAELYSLRPLFPGESEIDQIHNMISLLGSPTDKSWREGAILMKRMNLRLPPSKSPNQKSEGEDDTSEEDEKIDLRIEQIMPHGRRTPLAANLVRVLIQWNPSSRPSADEALEHAYNQTFGETKPARESIPKSKPENAVPDQLFESFREKVHHKSTKSNAIRDESVGRQELRSGTTKKGLNDDAQHSSRIDNQKCMISANNKEGILPNNHKFLFLGRSKIDSVAPARKESCKNDIEQENEFSSYISAVQSAVSSSSNPRSSIGNMLMPNNRGTSGRARPEETKPGRRIGNLVSTPFARRIDGVITPSARRDRISRATQNVDAGLPKKKGRRQQISQIKHHLDRKPEPMKPRWLLSKNMNMGKRAIEVTVSKTSGVDATLLENPQVSVHSEDDKVWIPF